VVRGVAVEVATFVPFALLFRLSKWLSDHMLCWKWVNQHSWIVWLAERPAKPHAWLLPECKHHDHHKYGSEERRAICKTFAEKVMYRSLAWICAATIKWHPDIAPFKWEDWYGQAGLGVSCLPGCGCWFATGAKRRSMNRSTRKRKQNDRTGKRS